MRVNGTFRTWLFVNAAWFIGGCGVDAATSIQGIADAADISADDSLAEDVTPDVAANTDVTSEISAEVSIDGGDSSGSGLGGPCMSSKECSVGVCNSAVHICVSCLGDTDCTNGGICAKNTCVSAVKCQTDGQCKATSQVCNSAAGVCVDCVTDNDCGVGGVCRVDHTCGIAAKTCASSKDCDHVCDKGSGICVECIADSDCTPAQFCSAAHTCVADVCSGPACGSGIAFTCAENGSGYLAGSSCDDKNSCTNDGCSAGICSNVPKTGSCDDGNACTSGETCGSGTCTGGSEVGCDDGIACTIDSCEPVKGCTHVPDIKNCTDSNPCTDDSCGSGGCIHTANSASCDDGDACTGAGICANSTCSGGSPISCDDGDDCTADSCVGGCVHSAISGCVPTSLVPCGGGIDCKVGICDTSLNACVGCISSSDCGGGAYCAQHKCVSGVSCTSDMQCKATSQVCNTAWSVCVDCKTAKDCGTNHACVESKCVAATPCSSSKDCPAICDTKKGVCVGCVVSPDCDSGEICDASQTCVPAYCKSAQCSGGKQFSCNSGESYSAPISCDDGNDCTTDACDSAKLGCWHASVADGTTCGAGATCGNAGKCGAGVCVGGEAKIWNMNYATDGGADAAMILPSSDGFFLIGGEHPGGSVWQNQVRIVRTTSDGSIVWDKIYGKNNPLVSAAATPAGGLLLVATVGVVSPSKTALTAVDADGIEQWTEVHQGMLGGPIVAVSTGYTLISPLAANPEASELMGIDPFGKKVWASSPMPAGFPRRIVKTAQGYAVLSTKGASTPDVSAVMVLLRTDAVGQSLGQVNYGNSKLDNNDTYAADLLALPDGFLLVGAAQGPYGSSTLVNLNGKLIRTDATGEVLWEKTFDNFQSYDYFFRVAELPDGFALFGITTASAQSAMAGWIVRIDAFGNQLWQTSFADSMWTRGYGGTANSAGLVIAGTYDPSLNKKPSEVKLWLAETDYFGNSTCATSGPCASKPADACADGNPCTADLCDAAHSGCWHQNLADGVTCATGKKCAAGVCK